MCIVPTERADVLGVALKTNSSNRVAFNMEIRCVYSAVRNGGLYYLNERKIKVTDIISSLHYHLNPTIVSEYSIIRCYDKKVSKIHKSNST
jgi:hypothetical protein